MSAVRHRANPLSADPSALLAFAETVDTAVRELDAIEWPDRKVFRDLVDSAHGDGSSFALDLRSLAAAIRKHG
jgi:hypothetical protein